MRHGKKFNHLSRTSAHRKAMLANMASSLIIHKRIKTTVAKAKALRTYIEPLITKSKTDSTHSRRVVFSHLNDKEAVTELFRDVSVKVADRPGGYTRIIKIGPRQGDNAEMALIELVDYNENLLDAKDKGPKKTRRRRGSAKKDDVVAAAPAVETAEEEVVEATDEATVETTDEVAEEAKEEVIEEKIEEVKGEEPKAEAKEEKIEEVKEEEPKAEAKEEKIEEVKEEEAKAEAKEEKIEEVKGEEAKAEVKEEKTEEIKEEDDKEKDKKE